MTWKTTALEGLSSDDVTPVITGIGVLSPIGESAEDFWEALSAGRSSFGPVKRFSTDDFSVHIAACLRGSEWADAVNAARNPESPDPSEAFAYAAAREAWESSGLARREIPRERVGVILGTSAGPLHSRSLVELTPGISDALRLGYYQRGELSRATVGVAKRLGIRGPTLTVSTACTSSTLALAHGSEWLESGSVDAVLVGGVDVLLPETYGGFHAMSAMSTQPCAPFSEPVGLSLGEGSGFVVLERARDARERSATIRGALPGHASGLDAFHATAPDPSGAGVAHAIARALSHAGITPDQIGYVNAHGTGTEANDPAEIRGLRKALGAHADQIPISSTKSYFGHTLGAAGVLEFIATLMALDHGVVLPTLNFTRPRGGGPADAVASNVPRRHDYAYALTLNAGFGGHNAALVVRKNSEKTHAKIEALSRRETFVLGTSVLSAQGEGLEGMDAALHRGESLATPHPAGPVSHSARMPEIDVREFARGIDPRGVDAMSRALLAVTSRALQNADVKIRGSGPERTGLYAVLSGISPDSEDEFWSSIRERGHPKVSTLAFAHIVTNTPAGAVSRALSIRGISSVTAGRPGTTLTMLGLCAYQLNQRNDSDAIVLASASVLGPDSLFVHAHGRPGGDVIRPPPGEIATALVLASTGNSPLARVAGCADSGPDDLPGSIRRALERAGCEAREVDVVYRSAGRGTDGDMVERAGLQAVFAEHHPRVCETAHVFGESVTSDGLALVAGVEALRRGKVHPGEGNPPSRVRTVLVVAAREDGGSHAVVLKAC